MEDSEEREHERGRLRTYVHPSAQLWPALKSVPAERNRLIGSLTMPLFSNKGRRYPAEPVTGTEVTRRPCIFAECAERVKQGDKKKDQMILFSVN